MFVNCACSSFKHWQLLCFANDMKLFLKVNYITDCLYLQNYLDNFITWSIPLCLTLNINKFKSVVLIHSRSLTSFFYSINGANLLPIDTNVCDLGFILTKSLCLQAHIDNITCNAFKVLGFIKKIAGEFKLSNSLKHFFVLLSGLLLNTA